MSTMVIAVIAGEIGVAGRRTAYTSSARPLLRLRQKTVQDLLLRCGRLVSSIGQFLRVGGRPS